MPQQSFICQIMPNDTDSTIDVIVVIHEAAEAVLLVEKCSYESVSAAMERVRQKYEVNGFVALHIHIICEASMHAPTIKGY